VVPTRKNLFCAPCLTTIFAFFATSWPAHAASPPPFQAAHAAVASDHPASSQAGIEVLKAGGNAIDAACATALALGVVVPHSSGIGGGGFALVYLARENKTYALDFRETAPVGLHPSLFLRDGKPDTRLSRRGGLAVGVPGEVRGLGHLVKRWGKRSFADCVRPAERLARGTPLTSTVGVDDNAEAAPFLAQVFTLKRPFALPLNPGEVVSRPALGRTLAKLRKNGPDAFYDPRGAIAQAIVKAVRDAGGVMTTDDLADYQTVERKPIEAPYREFRVVMMPPPSSGGVVMAEVLGILSRKLKQPPQGPDWFSSGRLHILTEAMKHGFADRARHLGDPDFVKMPLDQLLAPGYHDTLASRIHDKHILPTPDYGLPGPAAVVRDGGTSHLSVMDAEGNAVALTTTVNLWFGARLVAGDSGIVLNNQMDDFSLAPHAPNAFGLVGHDKNLIEPRKRPLSSMSPTLVLDDKGVKLAVGGSGGPTIISGTLQVLLNVVDGKMDAQAASASPRVHHQWKPNVLALEPDIARDVIEALERRGHETRLRGHIGKINVVARQGDHIEASSDPRGRGAPAGY
jgi:gamma-glutamyltranspeptidase/glutathione hydrolase